MPKAGRMPLSSTKWVDVPFFSAMVLPFKSATVLMGESGCTHIEMDLHQEELAEIITRPAFFATPST